MKRLIAVFLIAILISGCGRRPAPQSLLNNISASVPSNIPLPTSAPRPNITDLPALSEPVEETKLKIPWAKVIITTVVLAFLWGFVQENKELLRDRISRLGFWSDVYWADFKASLKHGYYWLCLNGLGVYSWLPEPKNDPEFDEYKMAQWLSSPVTPTVVYSSRPYVNEYWWDPKPPPEPAPPPPPELPPSAPELPPDIRPIQNSPDELDDLNFDDLFGDDESVYDNEEVKLQRMQELLTEIDATLGRIEIEWDSLRNWRSPEVVPVELDFDFFD